MGQTDGISRVHMIVRGRVQGVGFRYFVLQQAQAQALRLVGWTRNVSDGSVEVVAEGLKADMLLFVEQVRQGPPASRVDGLDVTWLAAQGEFEGFEVWR